MIFPSEISLKPVKPGILSLGSDPIFILAGDVQQPLCQILVLKVDFMLSVVSEVAIGKMLRVINSLSQRGRQVSFDSRTGGLDVVVMLGLVLEVEVVFGSLH